MNRQFFTDAFEHMPPVERENYQHAVFMNMDGEYAAGKRVEYLSRKPGHALLPRA